ncbi:putative bifunctional diguanylate cyclase/phosphodiesterase [Burkholderiaceae bacterium UC74_6]
MSHSRPAGPDHIDHLSIDALHRRVLSAVALGRPLSEVMTELCTQVELLAPGVICTVLAVHPDGRVSPLAAPSMPPGFSEAINGQPIGPKAGSCGTAAWRGEPVEVSDIANDPLWADYRELALAFGLAACWSTPVFRTEGSVGATFALYYREARPVLPVHRAMVESCVQLCQIALRHHEHELRIERLAYYDAVTGLPNRNLLADRTRQALHTVAQLEGHGALMLIDLDRFRGINESLGHRAGDALLHGLGQRLLTVAGPADTLARPGGDEFVLLLPNCGPLEAQQMAARLHAAIQAPSNEQAYADLQLTASIGISLFPSDGVGFEALLSNAELAMYEAKRAGLACTRFFHRAMNEALDARLRVEGALRRALDTEAFTLHFQPKLRLNDSGLAGAEVLLRWTDPELGPMPPDRFIPVAEEAGLVAAIDRWVLGAACAQVANWRVAGLDLPSLSVNVSPPLILQDDVAGLVAGLMERHGLRADELTLELTERLLLEDDEHAREQLRQLDAMGVRISLDDFGTGYSSLSYLKRLPVSELKLDRSFVHDLENDADDRALATAIIGIGRTFGLSVVAEGVETEGQRRILLEAGCELAQGWLFAPAMTAEAFAQRYLGARSQS